MAKARVIVVSILVATILPVAAFAQRGGIKKGRRTTTSVLPVLDSVSPSSKDSGSGSFILTTNGSNFTMGSIVRWNGSDLSTTYISDAQLQATVGSLNIASSGTATVTVFTAGRKGG